MRRLIWIALFLAILWCAWWAVFGWGLRSAIDTWFEERRTANWQAEYQSIQLRGFPKRVRADMEEIVLADTVGGLVMNLPNLSIGAPTYWPGDVTVSLPDAPIEFVLPDDRYALQIKDGFADLRLHPGTALELETLSATANAWNVSSGTGSLLGAQSTVLTMDQSMDDATTYRFVAKAADFQPGDVPRLALRLPEDWPLNFDTLTMDARITFDKPWDLSAIETARPQPRTINLKLAEAVWSDLRLFFAAEISIDDIGTPEGTLNVQAENWQVMLDLAQRSGYLPAALREQAETGLNTLARFSGQPTALDVQINLRGGMMFVGFIPVGPAPKFILR